MKQHATLRYFGWSALSVETPDGVFYFDPFYRKYCGADWFSAEDFANADYVAVTHGHEEHFLDVPEIARRTNARIMGPKSVTRFLHKRNRIAQDQLITLNSTQSVKVPGFQVDAFGWKHRDINLYKALTKAVFQGNTTQLAWAWHSATQAPFSAPYTGYRLTLPDGMTILNYNEGFNSKMTDAEIRELGAQGPTDVLLGGMQLDFMGDVERGVAALKPKLVLLYPAHEKFHDMMGVKSRPWAEFVTAAQRAAPGAKVVAMVPGTEVDLVLGSVSSFERTSARVRAIERKAAPVPAVRDSATLVFNRGEKKTTITAPSAPAAIGTYSQGVRVGSTIYLSGQIGLDPTTMQLADGIDAQIVRVFDNLKAVAEAAGGSLVDIVKLNVFLTDLAYVTRVNEIMGKYFMAPFPARAAIGIKELPRNALVEADAVMILGT